MPRRTPIVPVVLAIHALLFAAGSAFAYPLDGPLDNPNGDMLVDSMTRPAGEVTLDRTPAAYFPRSICPGSLLVPGAPPEGDAPAGATFTADGSQIVVAHRESKNLIVWDAATRAFVRAIPVSGSPQSVAVNAAGIAVVANVLEDTASIIDLATGAELAVIPVGRVPGIVQITADGLTAVVANTTSASFSIIDIASRTEVRRIAGGDFAATTSVNPESGSFSLYYSYFTLSGRRIIHPRRFTSSVAVIDIDTGTLTSIPTVAGPSHAVIAAAGTRAWVTHWLSNRRITEIDLATNTVVRTITTSVDLSGPLASNPAGTKLAVAIQNAAFVLDTATATVGPTLGTASINEMYTTADGLHAFCVGFNGSLISFSSGMLLANTNAVASAAFGCVSPVNARGAGFSNVFGEDMMVSNLSPASPGLEAFILSGPEVEADRCRTAGISRDGSRAVAVSIFSDSASIYDGSGTLLGTVKTGMRPAEVEIAPDNSKAVVCNLDNNWATIIDLATNTATNVTISRRASQVEISPDSRYAYVAVLADGDGLWKIDLLTNTVVGGKLATADMGSVGYSYQQNSGIALSHDGNTIVVCGGFSTPSISVVDPINWTVRATIPVGALQQPTYVSFSPDDAKFYVSYKDSDKIAEFSNAGAASALLRTVNVGDQPFINAVSADGSTLWVLNYGSKNLAKVNLATGVMTVVRTMANNPTGMVLRDNVNRAFVVHGNSSITVGGAIGVAFAQSGQLIAINTADGTDADLVDLRVAPSWLAASADAGFIGIPCPAGDGLFAISCPPPCPADFNQDGGINGADVEAFFLTWEAGADAADVNRDGGVDGQDVEYFFVRWEAGGC